MSGTLAQWSSASQKRVDVDALVQTARRSFQLLEPWTGARSDNATMNGLIQKVKKEGQAYYKALDLSIGTAEAGYTFSTKAEFLCDALLDQSNTTEEIQEYIQDMRVMAQRAHQDAKEASQEFRAVRQNLFEITKTIPSEVAKLEKQGKSARSIGASASVIRNESRDVKNACLGSALATSAGLAVTPAVVILPVALICIAIFSGVREEKYKRVAEERETEAYNCEEAMRQLQKATSDLSALADNVNMFADWWIAMDTMLGAIEMKVDELRAERILRIKTKDVKRGWMEVKDRYLGYKIEISALQDYYPSSRPRLVTN